MTTKVTGSVLANTAVTAGTYGGASIIPVVTVDAQGRLTSAANATPSIANSQITGVMTASQLAATAVTTGTYGGAGATPTLNHSVPVITVDQQGRLTSAANVTITNTAVYANTGQLTANVSTGVVAVGLATSGAIAGSYGSGTQTPVITIDAYGRVTSVSATTITGGSAGIGATTYNRQSNTATAGQTVFTVTGGYTVGYLQVYLNGVLLNAGDYTASNGTSFTLSAAASVGDIVESLAYTVTNVLNVSPSPSGGSAGQVLYQSAANTTANTDVGTANYLLTSQGTGKPTWSAQSALVLAASQLTGTVAASQLASTAVTPATYGGASVIPSFTVDQQGRVTFAANATPSIANSQITGVMTASQLAATAVTPATYGGASVIPSFTVDQQGRMTFAGNNTVSLANTAVGLGTTSNPQFNSLGVGTAGSAVVGEIRAANNITAYYTSDKKYKENIQDIQNALEKVDVIGGKLFDWTDEYVQDHGGEDGYFVQKADFGVIAQDVQSVFSIATRKKPDGTLAVDYEKLCALAFAAIKELKSEVEVLKGQIK